MKIPAGLILFATFCLLSCSKKELPDQNRLLGFEYFPVNSGSFIVYDVDSTVFTEIPRDTVQYRYRIKVKIAEQFADNEGKNQYRLERYIKVFNPAIPYDSMAWRIKEVWSLAADDKRILIQESNIPFVKLIFPVEEKASWNGNANNTLGEEIYYYDYFDRDETIGSTHFSNVLMVRQKDLVTLISENTAFEKFARNIGLVERQVKNIKSNNVVPGKSVSDRIESGLVYKQIFVSNGTE